MGITQKLAYWNKFQEFITDLDKNNMANRREAARLVKRAILYKARKMKKSGNLAKGVYDYHTETESHIGLHRPAYHNYLIEFGHLSRSGKRIPAYPIVYPTFEEKESQIQSILSRPVPEKEYKEPKVKVKKEMTKADYDKMMKRKAMSVKKMVKGGMKI